MIQLAELKAHLGTENTDGDPDADTVLVSLEERAVASVQRLTMRHFGPVETFVELLCGSGTPWLYLKEEPTAITSIEYRAAVGDAWEEIEDTAEDGWELREGYVIRKANLVWRRAYEYRVTYDFGYAPGEEPADVRGLVIDLVAIGWRSRGLEHTSSGRIGEVGYTLADIEEDSEAKQVIRAWRHPVVA